MGLKEKLQDSLKDFLLAAKRQIDKWQSTSTIHKLKSGLVTRGPTNPIIEFDGVPQYISCTGTSSNLYVKYSETEAIYVPAHIKWEVIFSNSVGYVKVVNRSEILYSKDKIKWSPIHLIGASKRKYMMVNELKVYNDIYYLEVTREVTHSVMHIMRFESLNGDVWKPIV